jgi:hypothetical protein
VGGIDNQTDPNGSFHKLSSAEIYDPALHQFVQTGSMSEGRVAQQATLLMDGRVLVTGGDGEETNAPVASAEIFDPKTGTFSSVGSMSVARVAHTAVLLPNGMVLVAGGQDSTFTNLNTAELFDPNSATFSSTGSMSYARTGHTATLLKNGKVLVAGGEGDTVLSWTTAELYDPVTGTFAPTGSMSTPRLFATATLLRGGGVLVVGGGSFVVGECTGCSVASAEIYEPGSGEFRAVGNMGFARRGHIAMRLKNHKVLVSGGIDDALPDSERFLSSAEIFDPQNLTFSPTSGMTTPRFDHAASLLHDGTVLITGGFVAGALITETAEFYDPQTGSFVATGKMTDARAEHTSTSLSHKLASSRGAALGLELDTRP